MIRKVSVPLLVLILTISGLVALEGISCETTTPETPEFTVQYVNHSYDIAPQSTVNPFTGETVVTQEGGHFDNWTIEVKITNQQFTAYKIENGNFTNLYYTLRFKGDYQDKWEYYPADPTKGKADPSSPFDYGVRDAGFIPTSASEFTVVALPTWRIGDIPEKGRVDIQVKALIGYDNKQVWGPSNYSYLSYYFEGQSSDWTATQVLTANKMHVSFDLEQVSIVVLLSVVTVLAVGIVVWWRKLPRK